MNTDPNDTGMESRDAFEERLRGTPLIQAPADLRAQILRKATTDTGARGSFAVFIRQLFWPHPVAWGGIAALWVIILGFRIATPRFDSVHGKGAVIAQDAETRKAVAAQRAELLAWLRTDSRDVRPDADRPKSGRITAPRSSLNFTNHSA